MVGSYGSLSVRLYHSPNFIHIGIGIPNQVRVDRPACRVKIIWSHTMADVLSSTSSCILLSPTIFRTPSINAQCWSMLIKILALIRNTSQSAMIGIGINAAILISIDWHWARIQGFPDLTRDKVVLMQSGLLKEMMKFYTWKCVQIILSLKVLTVSFWRKVYLASLLCMHFFCLLDGWKLGWIKCCWVPFHIWSLCFESKPFNLGIM